MQSSGFDLSAIWIRARAHPIALGVVVLLAACSGTPSQSLQSAPASASASPDLSGVPLPSSPNAVPAPAAAPVLRDARDADRISGTWLLTQTLTKVENVPYDRDLSLPFGARFTITQSCDHGACDAMVTVFDFTDASSHRRTMPYSGGTYQYPPETSTEDLVCDVGGKLLALESSYSGSLRPSGVADDGSGAARLSGTRTLTVKPIGPAVAAGCLGGSATYAVELVRTADTALGPVSDVPAELEVLDKLEVAYAPFTGAGPLSVAVLVVKNVGAAAVQLVASQAVVHSAQDGAATFLLVYFLGALFSPFFSAPAGTTLTS